MMQGLKAKMPRRVVKQELLDEDDSLGAVDDGVEESQNKMLTLSISDGKEAKSAPSQATSAIEVEPDEEEVELRRKLEQNVLEQHKAKL